MLPQPNRLSAAKEIYDTRNRGQRFGTTFVQLFVVREPDQTAPRFAFTIAKKVAKNAVDRNRTKRLLRESVREVLPTIDPAITCVCVAKQDLSEVPLQEVKADLQKVFQQAGIL